MSRRTASLVTAGVLCLGLGAGGAVMPVPYVTLGPGPTYNTLGAVQGTEVITITGHKSYPATGHLNMVTVSVSGGPPDRLNLFQTLEAWLDPHVQVLPEQELYPKGEDPAKVEQQNQQDMLNSQINAESAAFTELHVKAKGVQVESVESGAPADGKIKPGDVFVSIDGRPIATIDQVTKAIGAHKPGEHVAIVVRRGSKQVPLDVGTVAAPDNPKRPMVGVIIGPRWPFHAQIHLAQVGGPSAGMMFALAIIDKLTPGDLTGGAFVAGTGEITPDGQVGPIGGIGEKMYAARRDGATVFLAPAGNCKEALAAGVPHGLRLVRVATLHEALTAVQNVAQGTYAALPACTTK